MKVSPDNNRATFVTENSGESKEKSKISLLISVNAQGLHKPETSFNVIISLLLINNL